MAKGKQTCKILKEIRKQIAAENDIDLVVSECTYQGDCRGTCPKCEAEVRYLERELEKRQRMGKAAVFAGMSLGTLFAATSCNHPVPEPLAGEVMHTPDSTEMPNDSISNDSIPSDAYLLEGDVLAPEPDTMKAEEKKTACKKDELLEIVGGIEDEEGVTEGYVAPEMGEVEDPETVVYQIVEQMPAFPGGEAKLFEFISKNTHYPQEAKEKGIQGRVFIGFIVEKDGSISNVRNLRGVDSELDAEAIRVIQSLPKWKPGMHKGEFVRVSYQIPIVFKLEDKQD
jgi:TonB family protein